MIPALTKKPLARYYNLLKIVITLGVFALLFAPIGVGAILEGFSGVIWVWVLVRLLLYPLSLFLQVVRWGILLNSQGVSAPWRLLFQRYWMARFFDNFLPGRLAAIPFASLLQRES